MGRARSKGYGDMGIWGLSTTRTGIIGDGSERIHRQHINCRGEHSHRRNGRAKEAAAAERLIRRVIPLGNEAAAAVRKRRGRIVDLVVLEARRPHESSFESPSDAE